MARKKIWLVVLMCIVIVAVLVSYIRKSHENPLAQAMRGLMPEEAGMTSLHWAVWDGRIKDAEKLLANGTDINCRSKDGMTPLHFAVMCGHKKMVELLVTNGAEVNAKNEQRETPLYFAIMVPQADMVKLLLSEGAEVNVRNNRSLTPLDLTTKDIPKSTALFYSKYGKELKACAELLREHGAK